MASEDDKKKAQALVDEAERFYLEAKTAKERKAWAENTLRNMGEALELDPDNAEAWNNLGVAKSELGDHQGAIDDNTKSIEIDPKCIDAWISRGSAKSGLGDHQGAIEDYNKAIEIDPKHASAWNHRGHAKSELGDHQGAIADCTKGIELDPKHASAWSNRGHTKNQLGDYHGAIDDCTKAIEIDPKHASAWNNRGSAKSDLGNHQGAIEDYNKAIKLNPKNAAAWSNRGAAKYSLGKHDDALKDFDEALKLAPNNEAIQRNRQAADVAKKQNEYRGHLAERAEKFNSLLERNIWQRGGLFCIVVILIAGYIYWLWCMGVFSDISKDEDPFGLLPYLALLFTILSPLIWLIRINIRETERNLTLREDYYSRYIVEIYLERFFTEEDDRREFAQKYMTYWMYSNPSETLIRLANKSTEQPELPQVERIRTLLNSPLHTDKSNQS